MNGEQPKEEKKNDGPNISRASSSDVIYTGRGLDEKPSTKKPKTVEETLAENVRNTGGDTEDGAMTTLPKAYEGSVKATGRKPVGKNPYGDYIVWHNEARQGSYIKLTNPESGESVFAKVVGKVEGAEVVLQCAPKVCEQLNMSFNEVSLILVSYNN